MFYLVDEIEQLSARLHNDGPRFFFICFSFRPPATSNRFIASSSASGDFFKDIE